MATLTASDENELEFAIASYGEELKRPIEPEDFMNGAMFTEDGTLTEHALNLLASLDAQGAFI